MQERTLYLTDELERQLVLAEMEAQFQPRPLKALASLIKRMSGRLQRTRTQPLNSQIA